MTGKLYGLIYMYIKKYLRKVFRFLLKIYFVINEEYIFFIQLQLHQK